MKMTLVLVRNISIPTTTGGSGRWMMTSFMLQQCYNKTTTIGTRITNSATSRICTTSNSVRKCTTTTTKTKRFFSSSTSSPTFSSPTTVAARVTTNSTSRRILVKQTTAGESSASSESSTAGIFGTLPLQVTVGVLCASFWRGAWYIFDYTLFPDNRVLSSVTSLTFGSILLGLEQYILSAKYNGTKWLVKMIPPPSNMSLRTYYKKMNRFIRLYGIAISCILVWRGAWVMWDVAADEVSEYLEKRRKLKEPPSSPQVELQPKHSHAHEDGVSHHEIDNTLFYSGVASHVTATLGLLLIGRFKSVMAPPANVSMMRDIFIHGRGKDFQRAAKSFASER